MLAKEDYFSAWSKQGIEVSFVGTGRQTGKLLRMEVRNTSQKTVRFYLPKLTVLKPENDFYSTVLVEKGGAWDLPGGRSFKVPVEGYSLTYDKAVPKKTLTLTYLPVKKLSPYARYMRALESGLKFEKRRGLKSPFLSQSQHRSLVFQRVLWRVDGDRNPKDAKDLFEDLKQAMKSRKKPIEDDAIKALTASVWQDVERIYQNL